MFGSTVEYVLRSYTTRYTPVDEIIGNDGSMHFYTKEHHPRTKQLIFEKIKTLGPDSITTPKYPFKEIHLLEILEIYKSLNIFSSNILIHADSTRSAELNILFQYYKIAFGQKFQLGLEIFAGSNEQNIINWNPNYKHWSEMQPWEFREWFSLFYVVWVKEWIESANQVPDTFLKVTNTDILFNTKSTLLKIIEFCNLTLSKDVNTFVGKWISKQKYIVNEFNLLDKIVTYTTINQEFVWDKLSIVSEAIIQQRLRILGYNIKCDKLNHFPVNSKTLYNLLERC